MRIELNNGFASLTYNKETINRVFFCTDTHGSFTVLSNALKMLQFKFKDQCSGIHDFLINLGDITDRGNKSIENIRFFYEHQGRDVFSLRGNHEALMFLGTRHEYLREYSQDYQFWMSQGGTWCNETVFDEVAKIYAPWAYNLPTAAELNIDGKAIGLTHSEVAPPELFELKDLNIELLKKYPSIIETKLYNLWFRNKNANWRDTIKSAKLIYSNNTDKYTRWLCEFALTFYRNLITKGIEINVDGVDAILHGHTIQQKKPCVLNKSIYFDTGAHKLLCSSKDCYLTILEYCPQEADTLDLFKTHQFYCDEYGILWRK